MPVTTAVDLLSLEVSAELVVFFSSSFEQAKGCTGETYFRVLRRCYFKGTECVGEVLCLYPVASEDRFGDFVLHYVDFFLSHSGK